MFGELVKLLPSPHVESLSEYPHIVADVFCCCVQRRHQFLGVSLHRFECFTPEVGCHVEALVDFLEFSPYTNQRPRKLFGGDNSCGDTGDNTQLLQVETTQHPHQLATDTRVLEASQQT